MRRLAILLIAWVVCIQLPPRALGQQQSVDATNQRAVLRKALADFEAAVATGQHGTNEAQSLYHSALAGFESLVDGGVRNGRLFYNLANTYLRLGDVGRAILNYKRALKLMPGDVQVQRNLDFARKRCEVRIRKPASSAMVETLLFWHFGTSTAARSRIALAAYSLFWLLALGSLFLPRRIPALSWLKVVTAVLAIAVGTSAIWDIRPSAQREGVLISEDIVVRKGNGEYYDPQFEKPLPAGVEFQMLERRQDVDGRNWYRIQLSDGKDGWIRADQADLV